MVILRPTHLPVWKELWRGYGPQIPLKTQCSQDYDSMLDHIFLKANGNVKAIGVDILQPDPAYCEAETNGGADHRPVVGSFVFEK